MHVLIRASGHHTSTSITDAPLAINTRSGRIAHAQKAERTIEARGYWLLPGLINAHDHLELNHYPRTRFQDRYANAHQWGEAVSKRLHQPPFSELQAYSLADRCWVGGLKNLLGGVTTVAHHNPLHAPLRRANFPIDVVKHYGWAHSLHFTNHTDIKRQIQQTPTFQPFMIHLAEGTDDIAAQEYTLLAGLGGIQANTVLIHGVGLNRADRADAIRRGTGLVWCPSTNLFLLGQTAEIAEWVAAQQVALGSDSCLTADGDLLDELRAAWETQQVDMTTLLHLVTDWAAHLLCLADRGTLTVGKRADVLAIRRHSNDFYADLINTTRADIGLVMRGGRALYGDPQVVGQFMGGHYVSVKVDGRPKLLAAPIARQAKHNPLPITGLQLD